MRYGPGRFKVHSAIQSSVLLRVQPGNDLTKLDLRIQHAGGDRTRT